MNFKKNWKRFWSLSSAREGFTLVELIVVIAILAILAGVAVPAYSGYVTKANKQADITLISEIEHALQLAYYNQDLQDGDAGFLMIMPANAEDTTPLFDETTGVALAMEKTFGTNWQDTMQLKYDGWGVKNQMLSVDEAKNVVGSTFVQKYSTDDLMAQVQAMTDTVNGLSMEVGNTTVDLYAMFNYNTSNGTSNTIDEVIKEYNIGKSWDELSNTEKSNVLVLATAYGITEGQGSLAANVIPTYALYTAYAAENPDFKVAYETFQQEIKAVDPNSEISQIDQIEAAYDKLEAAAGSDFATWKSENTVDGVNTDASAFITIMKGVGNAMKDDDGSILNDLGNPDMFTTGIGYDLYNDYLNTAYATAGDAGALGELFPALQGGAFPGAIMVQYSVVDGTLYIQNTMSAK